MKKGEIEKMLREHVMMKCEQVVYKKGDLRLREDLNGTDDSVYVKPSDDLTNGHSMATDVQNAVERNPNEKDFTVDTSEYDSSNVNNDVTFDVTATNGLEAQKKIQKQMQVPQMRSLNQNGQLKANIHITDGVNVDKRLKKLDEGIHFTKAELDEFLRKL